MPKLKAINRTKRPDSKRIAKGKVVVMTHGGKSRAILYAPFDMRSVFGKAYRANVAALTAHLGGELTVPQAALVDQSARLRLLVQITWAELHKNGAFRKSGELAPAFDAYRKAASDERAVLVLLGIERRTKEVPTLHDYLKGNADGKASKEGNTDGAG